MTSLENNCGDLERETSVNILDTLASGYGLHAKDMPLPHLIQALGLHEFDPRVKRQVEVGEHGVRIQVDEEVRARG
jgi:ribosomal protein L9